MNYTETSDHTDALNILDTSKSYLDTIPYKMTSGMSDTDTDTTPTSVVISSVVDYINAS